MLQNVSKPSFLRDHIKFTLLNMEAEVLSHYKEAVDNFDGDLWKRAIDEEMNSLQENTTWRLVKLFP
ncbi:hypothetical protein MA16_Dca005059 [Dendrobium catenatum]|uniref:Uncharacterized protein n=1 Tax=Dendrobium catenatum TaxID=906689 RepID=A0A2I0WGU6_9ASPA|nr:hypothetical protein MA16_Dca005059 [Dendrobium catenatum]